MNGLRDLAAQFHGSPRRANLWATYADERRHIGCWAAIGSETTVIACRDGYTTTS